MTEQVAFLGLGTMGFPMARHLAAAGYQVTVYNRTAEKAARWVAAHGGRAAPTPAAAADGAAMVFTCVGNDDDLAAVVLGPAGAFSTMAPGAVLVDHTTASATLARRLAAEAQARGLSALDAPVSGGQAGAENGVLTVMVGGDAAPFAKAEPALRAFAREARLLGPAGSGQLAKMVNQICIAGLVQGLSEALNFGQRAGLDMAAVVEVIAKGAAQSWQMDNRAATMLEGRFDFGFAVDWMRKDLGIVLAEAARQKTPLPVTALVDQLYAEIQGMGGGRWDTTSLIQRLRRDA